MYDEISSGGVVFFRDNVLMLKKFNGDWVLPKGRVEDGETLKETAEREVFEEARVKATALKYLGYIEYTFKRNSAMETSLVKKTVHWYCMKARKFECNALHIEGFIEARYMPYKKAIKRAKYDDERQIIIKASDYMMLK